MGNSSTHRSRGVFYVPVHSRFFLLLAALLSLVLLLLFVDIVGMAFKTLFPNLGVYGIFLILATCLLGSYVNIPVWKYKARHPIVRITRVTVFGITYPIPSFGVQLQETLLAVNMGGAVVPTLASVYLMAKTPSALLSILIAVAVVAVVVKFFSRPVKGMGIVVPTFIPPFAAAFVGTLFGGPFYHVVAYVSGTLGTLIGADLLNLHKIARLGAPIASIGGAGTFDGVFLTGIVAVLIAF